MTYTLGLATMDNSAAALFRDGALVAAVEEERLSRIKNDGAFPHLAIRECLRMEGIEARDVGHIAVYWQPWRVGTRALGVLGKAMRSPMSRRAILSRTAQMILRRETDESGEVSGSWSDLFRLRKILVGEFGAHRPTISFHDHHLCHQLYAEKMRDWNEMISLSYDGGGEAASTVLTALRGEGRTLISRHKWPNSLGHFYSFFTGYLGFRMLEGEYKMMGLAPYGEPILAGAIHDHILRLEAGGRYRLNTRLADYHSALNGAFDPALKALFGNPRKPDEAPNEQHMNLAASVQRAFEDALIHLVKPARERFPNLRKLVVSGGCALNVTANGRLLSERIFDEIIIPPAPHDAGCAIGAAIASLSDRRIAVDPAPVRSPFLGAGPADTDIEKVLAAACGQVPSALAPDALVERTAAMLAEGLVVAWFQGRAEFGPRALGARSFLANPMHEEIREELNTKIKKRELFRPFAPSVTAEAASTFFGIDQQSPYMNIVAAVRPEMADRIPAVTHVDGTARVHSVAREANPLYHALIARFGEITGVPVLLNTSFNIQEPIVYTPDHAVNTFRASGVDALVIGPYIVRREDLT